MHSDNNIMFASKSVHFLIMQRIYMFNISTDIVLHMNHICMISLSIDSQRIYVSIMHEKAFIHMLIYACGYEHTFSYIPVYVYVSILCIQTRMFLFIKIALEYK